MYELNRHRDEGDSQTNGEIVIQNRGIFTDPKQFRFAVNSETGEKITLGEGSFGFVMLICHIQSNELYALKLIPLNSIETDTQRDIVEREARVHPELRHPFIIKMHDAFLNKGAIYIILEYAVNKTVADSFLTRFVYDESRAFKYFYQACLAIDYLHKKGIMHRDIKPENLLLDEKDDIKLCDFGWCAEIAKTNRSTLCGTFEYMAPEIIMQREYDYRIDLWQLGILLYELLHGRTPFKPPGELDLKEDDRLEYFKAQISQGRIVFDDHISDAAVHLISSMLVYVPEKRLSLAGVFAHIWVFKMKAKLKYIDSSEIVSQIEEAGQAFGVRKRACEDELHGLSVARKLGTTDAAAGGGGGLFGELQDDIILEERTLSEKNIKRITQQQQFGGIGIDHTSESWDEDMNERRSDDVAIDRSFLARESSLAEKSLNQSLVFSKKDNQAFGVVVAAAAANSGKAGKASSVYSRQLSRMAAGMRGHALDLSLLSSENLGVKGVIPSYVQRSLGKQNVDEEAGGGGGIGLKSSESRMSFSNIRLSLEPDKKGVMLLTTPRGNQVSGENRIIQQPSSTTSASSVNNSNNNQQQKNGLLRIFQ